MTTEPLWRDPAFIDAQGFGLASSYFRSRVVSLICRPGFTLPSTLNSASYVLLLELPSSSRSVIVTDLAAPFSSRSIRVVFSDISLLLFGNRFSALQGAENHSAFVSRNEISRWTSSRPGVH